MKPPNVDEYLNKGTIVLLIVASFTFKTPASSFCDSCMLITDSYTSAWSCVYPMFYLFSCCVFTVYIKLLISLVIPSI